jgi:hypothetical protein
MIVAPETAMRYEWTNEERTDPSGRWADPFTADTQSIDERGSKPNPRV